MNQLAIFDRALLAIFDRALLMVLILICFVGVYLFVVNRKNGDLGNAISLFGATMVIITAIIRIVYEYHPMIVIGILYVVFLLVSFVLMIVGVSLIRRDQLKNG